jgi:sugar phosphate isomerase/epimerase
MTKLSFCSWSFSAGTLVEACGVARALGFDGMDIGSINAAVDKQRILGAPSEAAAEIASLEMQIPCYFHFFGDDFRAHRNLADAASHAANLADVERVVTFCREASIPMLALSPGIVNRGQSREEAIDASASFLRRAVELAGDGGVSLIVEPGLKSIAESPAATAALLDQTPGLGLALDYSHFICVGWRQPEVDVLIPHARHVHLRQARPGRLQERFDSWSGTINFPLLLGTLREQGYDGWFMPEPEEWLDEPVDVLTETVKLRDLVREFA